jgi:hypothetical protein
MTDAILRRYWPPESQILLVIAAIGEPDAALAAWRGWLARRDLDTASWPEVRLLAAVSTRLPDLDPDSPLLPRLQGIRRFIWTQTQMCLAGGKPLLAALHAADVPMLLLKGAARIAEDPAAAARRLVRDIDVLVGVPAWARALEIADAEGWRPKPGSPYEGRLRPGTAGRVLPSHHSIAFKLEGAFENDCAEVDLHHASLFMCRNAGDDDGLWRRARPAMLQGVPVRIPAPEDELLHTLVHGTLFGEEPTADWAPDAATLIRAGRVHWAALEAAAAERHVEPAVVSALMLLAERAGIAVPGDTLARLRARIAEPFLSDFVSFATAYRPEQPALIEAVRRAACVRAADAAVRRGLPGAAGPRVLLDATITPGGWPLSFELPPGLPADAVLRLRVDLATGADWPAGGAALDIACPGLQLDRWRLRPRYRLLPRPHWRLDVPGALFVARHIARVTIDPVDPALRAAITGARLRIRRGSAGSRPRPAAERPGTAEWSAA